MDDANTGSILINLVDGTRQPLAGNVKWSARIHDGRPPSQWRMVDVPGAGSAELIKGLTFFDNLFDSYTVIVNSDGFDDAAWMPVHLSPAKPAAVDLMLMPKEAHLNFSNASWPALNSIRPRFAQIFSAGINDAQVPLQQPHGTESWAGTRLHAQPSYRYVFDYSSQREDSPRLLLATDMGRCTISARAGSVLRVCGQGSGG